MTQVKIEGKQLEKLREHQLNMLIEIDRICAKHKLTYFLLGGTLLGAVRHGGFIPWDDDVDISMPRNDLEKLQQICKTELNSKYFFQSVETDKGYPLMGSKLRVNNTLFEEECTVKSSAHKGVFIDIMPMDDLFDPNEAKVKKRVVKIMRYTGALCERCGYKYGISKRGKISAVLYTLIGVEQAKKKRDALMKHDNNKNAPYITWFGSHYGYEKQTFEKEVYFPPKKIKFCGIEFSCPNDTEKYLVQTFGDYMQLPPEDKRETTHQIVTLKV